VKAGSSLRQINVPFYFRVKLKAPLPLLVTEEQVKAGLRGMGYVKVDPAAAWPAWLAVKAPND
jgi:HlyD family secretion protein